jgi:hypothetical protein
MVNSEELIRTKGYLTLYARCHLNGCRYNQVQSPANGIDVDGLYALTRGGGGAFGLVRSPGMHYFCNLPDEGSRVSCRNVVCLTSLRHLNTLHVCKI